MVHKRKTVIDLEQRAIERKKKYVLYPVKEIMEDMNRSEASVSKHLSELEDTRLLERMQSAPGRPCKLYLKKLSYVCEV